MGAGRGFRSPQLWGVVLFLAFAVVCTARQAVTTLPGDGALLAAQGRALMSGKVTTDDYADPSANPAHDPKTGGGGKGGGRN